VLDGVEKIRLASSVFKQNVYNGVFESLEGNESPSDLDFFNINEKRFPLLKEIEPFLLEATLQKGDCVYIPNRSWF
jgi:hypothetical protein